MKTKILLTLVSLFIIPHSSFAQGALSPPGAPVPTMKTLAQIEPRTPVDAAHTPGDSSSTFIINQPGSYYLTTNLVGVSAKYGIEVLANNVVLDLNGFALLGVTNSDDGISQYPGYTNLMVSNGTLSGWGTGFYGIRCQGQSVRLERLVVSGNGFGIYCPAGSLVKDCVIDGNFRDGLDVNGSGSLILNNTIAGNNLLNGIGNASVTILGSNNRIEGNHITGSSPGSGVLIPSGVGISDTNNIVVRNFVSGCGPSNYTILPGNIVGPLINNTASGIITNANPWANFSF